VGWGLSRLRILPPARDTIVSTTMIYTHVLNRALATVRIPGGWESLSS